MTDRNTRTFVRTHKATFFACALSFVMFMASGYSGYGDVSVLLFSFFEFSVIFLTVTFVFVLVYQVFLFMKRGDSIDVKVNVFFLLRVLVALVLFVFATLFDSVASGEIFPQAGG